MTAQIVMTAGGPPVVGTIVLPHTDVGTPVTLSNFDDTGINGWKWEVLDAPPESPTLYPLPPPTYASTRVIAPDVEGHTVLVRLTTYLDAARTIIDGIDQKAIKVRFAPPFTWIVPAAGETVEQDMVRGWATEVNRLLREVHSHMHDFSYTKVEAGEFLHIRPNHQMLVHGVLTVDGVIQNDGDISFV